MNKYYYYSVKDILDKINTELAIKLNKFIGVAVDIECEHQIKYLIEDFCNELIISEMAPDCILEDINLNLDYISGIANILITGDLAKSIEEVNKCI